jgi:hypothetical protein
MKAGFRMKKIVPILMACLALAGCTRSEMNAVKEAVSSESAPVEKLLTPADVSECKRSMGIAPSASSTDVSTLSAETLEKVRNCALELEKQRMPLLADLIDKYIAMLRQGDQECSKDIGTRYGDLCLRNSHKDAAAWYNLAVSQRLRSELLNQQQSPAQD